MFNAGRRYAKRYVTNIDVVGDHGHIWVQRLRQENLFHFEERLSRNPTRNGVKVGDTSQ